MITDKDKKVNVCWWCKEDGELDVLELESDGIEVMVHRDCSLLIQSIQNDESLQVAESK